MVFLLQMEQIDHETQFESELFVAQLLFTTMWLWVTVSSVFGQLCTTSVLAEEPQRDVTV